MIYDNPHHTDISIEIDGKEVFKDNVYLKMEDARKLVEKIAEEKYSDKDCDIYYCNNYFGGGYTQKATKICIDVH